LKKTVLPAALIVALVGAALARVGWSSPPKPVPQQRAFAFIYSVHVPANPAAQQSHLWIPLPQSAEDQKISNLSIESSVPHKIAREPEYGNAFALFTPSQEQIVAGYDVSLKFDALRIEDGQLLHEVSRTGQPSAAALQRYLQPDKMVPLNATIAELARTQTEGIRDPLAKARKIYDYVASTMRYDKSGEGWGRGDAMWACDSKRGNCTDFHSVLIGMMRASGIPARFEIGFPLPENKSVGDIPGYHCWAEFYLPGKGWIPVDASEASKYPAKRDYFFGTVDADRVRFTYGRDLRLSAEQKGEPLNYFIYPYAEINGQPLKGLTTHFSFRDLPPPASEHARN
jgi:hypothetical protein